MQTNAGEMGHTIIHKQCTDSTNEDAKRGGDSGAEHGTVYTADRQNAGKGRRGRSWLSESVDNLYFTLLLRPDLAPEKVTMLTLVMAYAVSEAIDKTTGLATGIKWPNDIVVNSKKVCGILSEMKLNKNRPAYCVIGVGINMGQVDFPQELLDKATSLYAEADRVPDKQMLLREILNTFETAYTSFLEAEALTPILEPYNARLVNRNRNVRVLEPGGEYEGISLGVTATGELLVEKTDKSVQKIYAGEVSVRGLYGYV